MRSHWRYLRYIIRHKWFVLVESWALGITWLGIIHDWSKFLPSEWGPYAEWFYGEKCPTRADLIERDHSMGRSGETALFRWMRSREDQERDFDYAWNHHQKTNKHHWQYFLLVEDDGPIYPLPMPDVCRRELLADWRGAGRAVNKLDIRAWYLKQKELGRMNLHPETRAWIEQQLGVA